MQTNMSAVTDKQQTRLSKDEVRILFVSGFVADTYSEIERQYVELCSRIDLGVEFLWLVPNINCKYNRFARSESRTTLSEPVWVPHLRNNNVPYITGDISKYNFVLNFLLFRKIFQNNHIDAVYTHFGFERFWATLFGKLWRKKTIWNEHWHSLGTRYVFAKRFFYWLFVDEYIAVSRFIACTLPSDSKVHIVRNAIRADMPAELRLEAKCDLRRQLGIPESAKVVLMVSAFRPNKYHDLAIQVCEKVLSERNDVVFVFLGEGSTRPWVAHRVKELGFDVSILMPGHVDNVDDYYLIADICMLTSLGEPCALAVVEAMKFSKPLVAFDSGGTPEIIRSGENGILVTEHDVNGFATRLLELIEGDEKRFRIGKNALQTVQEQADREAWIKRLTNLLRDIVSRNSGATSAG
jgi:L-malate glycosyltransferase